MGSLLNLARIAMATTIQTDGGARYWWRVRHPDGRTIDFCALPELDRQQVRDRYPGADVEPLPDDVPAAPLESEHDTRAPAREAGPYTSAPLADRDPRDDRRTCTACANLSPQKGRCLAAWRGDGPGLTGRHYHPIADLLGRCECYRPLANEVDQRTGGERWPEMIANTKRLRGMRHG